MCSQHAKSALRAALLLLAVLAALARGAAWAQAPALCAESRADIQAALDDLVRARNPDAAKLVEALLDRRIGKDSQGRCLMIEPGAARPWTWPPARS